MYAYSSSPNSVPLFDEISDVPAVQKDGTVNQVQKEKCGGEFTTNRIQFETGSNSINVRNSIEDVAFIIEWTYQVPGESQCFPSF